MGVRDRLRAISRGLDDRWDEARLGLLRSLGGLGPIRIFPYRGLGRPDRLLLKGRVMADRGPTSAESDDDLWDNLVNMYRRIHTTEIPGARVRVSAAGAVAEVVTDEEGYFDLVLEAAGRPFSPPLQRVVLELLEPSSEEPVRQEGEAVVRSPRSSFLVLSDVDDTLVHTHATNLLAMACHRPRTML